MSHSTPFRSRGAMVPAVLLSLATVLAPHPCPTPDRGPAPGRVQQPARLATVGTMRPNYTVDGERALLNRWGTRYQVRQIARVNSADGRRALLGERQRQAPHRVMAHRARPAADKATRSPCS